MPSILKLSNIEAKNFFLEGKSYVGFVLPPYIVFDNLIQKLAAEIGTSPISSYYRMPNEPESGGRPLNPKDFEDVNYKLVSNKDGGFAWRPIEIIHPALYIALVNDITSDGCWQELLDLFKQFGESAVLCESIPYKADDEDETHLAHQIKRWWTNVEQASIITGLEYQYVLDVDVSDCYGSIYTHSIAWAIHGKEIMKIPANRSKTHYLGNRIDWAITQMRHGQTNGIPQGSALMDFIAEIIMGYVDTLLTQRLDKIKRDDYKIVRYRDDYKIFTNKPELGNEIVRILSEVLSSLGMRLNTSKTKIQNDSIIASVKEDKLYELFIPKNPMYLSKWLLQIYMAIEKYPNSGMAARLLERFFQVLDKTKSLRTHNDPRVMISIIVNIAVKNPKAYPYCMAILSKLLDYCEDSEKVFIISKIIKRFSTVPNSGMLDIWLQRVSYKVDPFIDFKEKLTRIVSADELTNVIWNSNWLKPELESIVNYTSIIDRDYLERMAPVIPRQEVALFNSIIFY